MKIIVNQLASLFGFFYNVYQEPVTIEMGNEYELVIQIDFYESMKTNPYGIFDGLVYSLLQGDLLTKHGIEWFADYMKQIPPTIGIVEIIFDSEYEKELFIHYTNEILKKPHEDDMRTLQALAIAAKIE